MLSIGGNQLAVASCATWLLLIRGVVIAGFACLSNPCIHGVCMDDINSTYSCYCIDGYTGIQCQTNWNECWSSPCKNGGVCIDGIAAYNCSCPDGYVGENCEENFDECSSNPCLNNGTCTDVINGYQCTCLLGYLGVHCEIDVAVCNTTEEARCSNGGVCVEGRGMSFSCRCAPGWTGTTCDTAIDECQSAPCKNGGICIDRLADYDCACPFGKNCEMVVRMCEDNACDNDALCLMEDDAPVCYCVPDYHGEHCQYQYDECQLGPRCMNGGTCIDGIDSFTCSCPPGLTGILCECLIISENELDCTYVRTTDMLSTLPTEITATINYTTLSTIFSTLSTEASTELSTKTTELSTTFVESSSSTSSTYVPNITIYTETSTFTTEYSTSTISETTTESTTETTSISTPVYANETTQTQSIETTLVSTDTDTTTMESTVETETTALTTYSTTFETYEPTYTSLSATMEALETSTPSSSITTSEGRQFNVSTELSTITTEMSTTTTEMSTATFLTQAPTATMEYTTETTPSNTTNTIIIDCSESPCKSGGTCVLTSEGHRCICPFDAEGPLCERPLGIKNAAFNGKSYLTHRLYNSSGIRIQFQAKTFSPNGVLFYSNNGDSYMCLYMLNGFLKFKFSCGYQTMLLSELKVPVNSGFDLKIDAKLEFLKNYTQCNASLMVNNTLAMSGTQTVAVDVFKGDSWLHLGGIPEQYVHEFLMGVPGFVGCIEKLKIDNKSREIFQDADDGISISECSSLACLSSPCLNGGSCVENKNKWNCSCKNGFVGNMCERSVCENNPCQFGGTCVSFTGGYICLCPYGKHGHFCENDLQISEPSFSSTLHGLSSFVAYPIPDVFSHNMEMRFKFIPTTLDQISLLMFVGQKGPHDSLSDHMSISFVKGYIMLTWNLGSGPRRIFTSKQIDFKDNHPHTIHLGRVGRRSWIVVDDMGNITGRSPGNLVGLDVEPLLFIGGHRSLNFSTLPHDLPLHVGFSGCIFDIEMKSGSLTVSLQGTRQAIGRAVSQCGTSECHDRSCQNDGICLHHGGTYSCLCQDGWFGPLCSLSYNPCDFNRHNCSSGSTCVPLIAGYECDCPLGKTGEFCERNEVLSDVSLSGNRSYLSVASTVDDDNEFAIEFQVRPLKDHGLLLFIMNNNGGSFVSVFIQGGVLEARFNPGKPRIGGGKLISIHGSKLLAIGLWYTVRISKYGRQIYLSVDNSVSKSTLNFGDSIIVSGAPIFIGGLPDLSKLPSEATSMLPVPFTGCVRQLMVNYRHIPLTEETVMEARNIADCDGTPCGGDVCDNGGACWLDPFLRPHCACPKYYAGDRCETQASCSDLGCNNRGRCINSKCFCTVGWSGTYCEDAVNVKTPQFKGESYMVVDRKEGEKKRDLKMGVDLRSVYLNFTTASLDGLLLWSNKGDEFVGIGVENGHLKLAWAWKGASTFVIEIPAIGPVADGLWHDLTITFTPRNVTLWIDRYLVHRQTSEEATSKASLATDGVFYLGGFPSNVSMLEETRGLFTRGFKGCIQCLRVGRDYSVTNFSSYPGENVGVCGNA